MKLLKLLVLITPLIAVGDTGDKPLETHWGVPNLDGVWDFRTLTPLERPPVFGEKELLTPEEAEALLAQILPPDRADEPSGIPEQDVEGYNAFWLDPGDQLDRELRTSLIIDPANGRLPKRVREADEQRIAQNQKRTAPVRDILSYSVGPKYLHDGPESLGLSERCLVGFNAGPPLMPGPYNNNLRIVQTPDYVMLMTEMVHDVRVIPLNGRPEPPPDIRQWYGISRGRWEGGTLVVETTNFTDKTPGFHLPVKVGHPTDNGVLGSGLNLKVVERFSLNDEGQLIYVATVDAPDSFARPFTMKVIMQSSDEKIFEYACHEGNYALGGILRGARLQEAEAASPEPGN